MFCIKILLRVSTLEKCTTESTDSLYLTNTQPPQALVSLGLVRRHFMERIQPLSAFSPELELQLHIPLFEVDAWLHFPVPDEPASRAAE